MKNRNAAYWKGRFEQIERAEHAIGQECFADIDKQYKVAQKAIEADLDRWYRRFAENNQISLTEARRWLTGKDLEEFRWDVHEYIRHGEENAVSEEWMKELENASARFHISRLDAMKLQLQQHAEVLFGNQQDSIDHSMRRIYEDDYYHTAFEIQKGIGVGWDLGRLDERRIEKVINKPWAADGRNFSDRIWTNKQKLIEELQTTFTQGVILGKDPQKTIDVIAERLRVSKSNAGRLVMTEQAAFASAAQRDCFKDLGVEEYEIVATLDNHTSDICQAMDGQHFKMSEYEVGITAPPFHVWCRSTTVPYFDDEWGRSGERAARDANGETYYVPAGMTYKEWQKAFTDGDNGKQIGPSLARYSFLSEGIEILNFNGSTEIDLDIVERNLSTSDIGNKVLKYLKREEIPIKVLYGVDNPEKYAGQYDPFDDLIVIFGDENPNEEEATLTLIHEARHRMLGAKNTQQEEFECFKAELLHVRKGKLTQADLDDIMAHVKKYYSHLPKK